MSELKAFRIIQGDTGGYGAPSYKCDTDGNRIEEWSDVCEVYDRFEVDKVIAEKDKEIRRQKYRRCLVMAYVEWLKQMSLCYYPESILYRIAYRRERKWKEFAKKFKPNNSTIAQ